MKAVFETIGTFSVGVIIISFPILLTCSFLLNWYDFVKFIFVIGTIFDFIFILNTLADVGK